MSGLPKSGHDWAIYEYTPELDAARRSQDRASMRGCAMWRARLRPVLLFRFLELHDLRRYNRARARWADAIDSKSIAQRRVGSSSFTGTIFGIKLVHGEWA